MSTCHILKSVCLACGKTFSTKLKLCKKGVDGRICTKLSGIVNADKVNIATLLSADESGRTYLDLTEIVEVVVVRNRNPLCSCGESMGAPNTRQLEELEDLSTNGSEDEFATGRGHVEMET